MSKSPARKPNNNAARRSAARLSAVQALYSMEITGVSAQEALDEFRSRQDEPRGRLAEPDGDLVAFIVVGATAEAPAVDEIVGRALSRDWTVERLEAVLRAILRAGAFEIKSRPQTPARVAISEYVDVAHAFYAGPEPGLVNAVLDRVARALRPEEFEKG
ncbi:MAG: transcription antitermination factor NusB [Solirubrobacterales bacterium]